jgi:hypothetical protein
MGTSKNVIRNIKMAGIHNENFPYKIKFILAAYVIQFNEINILHTSAFSTRLVLLSLLLLLLCLHLCLIIKNVSVYTQTFVVIKYTGCKTAPNEIVLQCSQ